MRRSSHHRNHCRRDSRISIAYMLHNFFKEFKEFAVKGSVVDLAVGVIIGTAFGKIVTSLVNDIIMPPVGWLVGKADFSEFMVGPIRYGVFLNAVLDFIIVALVIFLLIKQVNRIKRRHEPDPTTLTRECPFCKSKISPLASKCPHCTSNLP